MDRIRYFIGLLTLGAIVIAGWFLIGLLADEDRSGFYYLKLEFRDVRGLKEGAAVKFRGVGVGTVRDISISDDGEKGVVTISLDLGGEDQSRNSSKFWIVAPRFSGITSGVSGLDTLVRDSYVSFVTPKAGGPKLAPGSLVVGLEKPFQNELESSLEPVRHGDLCLTLLVTENHGLTVGADVMFRGMPVGEVRRISLASAGTHVELELCIRQSYRQTVTDQSTFWVARPRLSGALLGGISVEDISALLRPFIGYWSQPGKGLPVADNYRVVAAPHRPNTSEPALSASLGVDDTKLIGVAEAPGIRVVQVLYEAVEEDWLTPNDLIERKGSGLMYVSNDGRVVVVTARSLVDASYTESDVFGLSADVTKEATRIAVPGGTVLRAGRTWVDPAGGDLALLIIEDADAGLPVTPGELLFFGEVKREGAELRMAMKAEVEPLGVALPDVVDRLGAVVVADGKAAGIFGAVEGVPAIVPLSLLPQELRPKS